MRILLIGCEVIIRELCDAVARSPHVVDARFLSKGLHDRGARVMRAGLQAAIDEAEADAQKYDAIALGYGLCGNGLAGLEARSVPLVLPRAHDCITLLMGSRIEFERYFQDHPGVYYRSTGWVERGADLEPLARTQTGMGYTLDALIEHGDPSPPPKSGGRPDPRAREADGAGRGRDDRLGQQRGCSPSACRFPTR